MDINLIGSSIFYGCDIPGVENAPAKLRDMGLVDILQAQGHSVTDLGDVTPGKVCSTEKYACHTKMKYVDQIRNLCGKLSDKVTASLRENRFPLVIGGDHSGGIGVISGVSRVYGGDIAVMWIDSHSDIHEFATSESGNVHGVPLGASIGLKCGQLNSLFDDSAYIKGENIYIIGLRSYERQEMQIMERFGVNHYSVDDVRRLGVEKVMAEIITRIRERANPALHLSFDIDSLDPSIAPGTGIREPHGLTESEASQIVTIALGSGFVRSMDISELNPARDIDDMTSRLALRVAGLI